MERPITPEILEAMEEVERMIADPTFGKNYTDVDLMFREILAEDDDDGDEEEENFNEETRRVLENMMNGENLVGPFYTVEELMEHLDSED